MNDYKERLASAKLFAKVEVEKVKHYSLKCCSMNYGKYESDPGWEAEMYDELLRKAILEAASAINAVKVIENENKSRSS